MNYGFGGILMWLIILALAVLIIYFVVLQTRKSGDSGGRPKETPLEILKKICQRRHHQRKV